MTLPPLDQARPDGDPQGRDQLLGQLLLQRQLITEKDLEKALALQQQISARLGGLLIRVGALSEDALLPVLAEQLDMPLLQADELPDIALLSHWLGVQDLPLDWWLDQEVLAWESADGRILCVARDPLDTSLVEVIERRFADRTPTWRLLRNHHLDQLLDRLARLQTDAGNDLNEAGRLRELAEEAPVIEFVNNLVAQAFDQSASDVHIEPGEHSVDIRFRIDGILFSRFTLPRERFNAIASRIKLVSGMDIAEQRLPQDGHMDTRVSGEALDIRVSALPGVHGESIVMRLLPKEKKRFDLDGLGLSNLNLAHLSGWVQEPHGILLVTGPTGSGKSTTLYALLDSINQGARKIITVEDPVEYRLPGIIQVQTQAEIDYDFARALRAILRQDPDVIMIGEIRDKETAEIAIQSSLTGHLVLSTLHTNDAISAFTRLIDMGVEPFLVATPIRAVMAQRLVRRLCRECARPATPLASIRQLTENLLADTDPAEAEADWREAVGCDACQGQGYRGRLGIHELVPVCTDIQRAIVQGCSVAELQQIARDKGIRSLRDDGFLKARLGLTTAEEVLRVTAS
jgi:general secretion pathway protein E